MRGGVAQLDGGRRHYLGSGLHRIGTGHQCGLEALAGFCRKLRFVLERAHARSVDRQLLPGSARGVTEPTEIFALMFKLATPARIASALALRSLLVSASSRSRATSSCRAVWAKAADCFWIGARRGSGPSGGPPMMNAPFRI